MQHISLSQNGPLLTKHITKLLLPIKKAHMTEASGVTKTNFIT
jgi:hypothetical protein